MFFLSNILFYFFNLFYFIEKFFNKFFHINLKKYNIKVVLFFCFKNFCQNVFFLIIRWLFEHTICIRLRFNYCFIKKHLNEIFWKTFKIRWILLITLILNQLLFNSKNNKLNSHQLILTISIFRIEQLVKVFYEELSNFL